MACFMPFSNRNLDISVIVLRPTVAIVDRLLESLKDFCLFTEKLGCMHCAILRSIHGSMIIWYGAWIKRSIESKELVHATLLSALTKMSSMAVLIDEHYFDAYGGESRDGSPTAKFSTGDIISLNKALLPSEHDMNEHDFTNACLAIFRSHFLMMDGAIAGVCLKCPNRPMVTNVYVWKHLQSCYSWFLQKSDGHRQHDLNYFDGISPYVKHDIFKVDYVSADNVLSLQLYPPHRLLGDSKISRVVQD